MTRAAYLTTQPERRSTRAAVPDGVEIAPMQAGDWDAVRRIYEEGIATGNATFEIAAPRWEEWDAAHLDGCRLVARRGDVVAWAALGPYSRREAYAGVAEVSIYVGDVARGKGVGRALLQALVDCTEAQGIWTLQAGVFRENETSLRLHRSLGFRTVGVRRRIGRLNGRWRDVVLLERRSSVVGID
jgi:L-amino acid N-acyltransferase YncA